jgi:cobalt/nickel transport system permease protein
MHIADGVLPVPTLISGFVLAGGWVAVTARKLTPDDMPRIAVMSAAFFVGSAITFPLGVTSAHLLLHGLVGIILGVHSVLAIGIGLIFQKLLLGHGGISTLGINACIMGYPAALLGCVYARFLRNRSITVRSIFSGVFAAATVALSTVIAALVLITGGEEFRATAATFLVSHVPIILVEGGIAAVVVRFLSKVKPELLGGTDPALDIPYEDQPHAS